MPHWSLWNFNNTIALYASWNFAHGTVRMICWKERIKKGSICKIEGPMIILTRGIGVESKEYSFFWGSQKQNYDEKKLRYSSENKFICFHAAMFYV